MQVCYNWNRKLDYDGGGYGLSIQIPIFVLFDAEKNKLCGNNERTQF